MNSLSNDYRSTLVLLFAVDPGACSASALATLLDTSGHVLCSNVGSSKFGLAVWFSLLTFFFSVYSLLFGRRYNTGVFLKSKRVD